MAIQGSVNSLFESAARRGNIPDSQMTYLLEDFMAMSQEELFAYALPLLHARREDYYLEELMFDMQNPDCFIGGEPPSNTAYPAWRIPDYAMAGTVRDVQAISPNGSAYNLGRVEVDDVPNMIMQGWFFYGNYIVYQSNSAQTTQPPIAIKCVVHTRPSQMIPIGTLFNDVADEQTGLDQCAKIVSITSETQFEVDRNVDLQTQTSAYIDIVSGESGYEVKTRNAELVVSIGPGTTLTLASIPSKPLKVGDWIARPGWTPMVPLPLELHPVLSQRIVVKFLEAQGEESQLNQARGSLEEMARQVPLLIQPRAEGKPKKLAPRLGLWRRWRW